MYVLPKIHTPNTPLRPILAVYITHSFRIAKYLVLLSIVEHLTTDQYTIKYSCSFQIYISKFGLKINSFFASYSIPSLATMNLLQVTIDITCSIFFPNAQIFDGFNQAEFQILSSFAYLDICFLFNNVPYLPIFLIPLFSLLGISYLSNTTLLYKLNFVWIRIHRAYQLCSSYSTSYF